MTDVDKIDVLIEKLDELVSIVKSSIEENVELRGIIEKKFEELVKAEAPEPAPPVDMATDDKAEEEVVDEAKKGEEERDSNDGDAAPTGDEQKHEEATEEIVKASTPEPPGDVVVEEDVIVKFLKGELDIPELDKIFG